MCARYQLELTHTQLAELLDLVETWAFEPTSEVRPTDEAPVVLHSRLRGGRMATPMRWGLVPSWARSRDIARQTFNARVETAAEKPSFRAAWRRRHAVVPASGWYEWTGPRGAKKRWRARSAEGAPLWLAGLWESWTGPEGDVVRTFTVLTRDAQADLVWLHDRMPVVLATEQVGPWLERTIEAPPEVAAPIVVEEG